jgi:hypothetical protein
MDQRDSKGTVAGVFESALGCSHRAWEEDKPLGCVVGAWLMWCGVEEDEVVRGERSGNFRQQSCLSLTGRREKVKSRGRQERHGNPDSRPRFMLKSVDTYLSWHQRPSCVESRYIPARESSLDTGSSIRN